MSETSRQRSEEFVRISPQFQLGLLVTEASHPATAHLSEVAARDVAEGLDLLFQVDEDVVARYREFAASGRAGEIAKTLLGSLRKGGRIFFTGCGSTGRLSIQLDSIWRDFWQQQRARGLVCSPSTQDWENRTRSVMAGGDFALIKSVEGFEDFTAFGREQMGDLGVSHRDVVFAITEGGETSFVIGTAWQGLEAGAKVYFVYNNPDEVLCHHVQRSREVIADSRIEKINLTTGPMAITGSTRMQATTIQLCVLLTVMEIVLRELMKELAPESPAETDSAGFPQRFLDGLVRLLRELRSPDFRGQLASLVALEEHVYRGGHRNNYYADQFALDVLTDTTERSPTYCTPPFRKFDDLSASDSWAYLFTPERETARAWEQLLKRPARCVEWTDDTARALVPADQVERTCEVLRRIRRAELLRFRIGQDGLAQRPPRPGDSAIGILCEEEAAGPLADPERFLHRQLSAARAAGAKTGLIWVGEPSAAGREFANRQGDCISVLIPVPSDASLLRGLQRVGLKLVMNALSTCTMVRLGRVMGNYMVWVVPSNLKLIDRATRYIEKLAGLSYDAANRLLFEVIEYIEPRMKADQAYPPAVLLALMRARHGIGNEEAEASLRCDSVAGR